jgi:hypothetical protein
MDVLTRRLAGLVKHRGIVTSDPWKHAKAFVREHSVDNDLASLYDSKPREAVRRMFERLTTRQLAPREAVEAWLDALGDDSEDVEKFAQRDPEDRHARIARVLSGESKRSPGVSAEEAIARTEKQFARSGNSQATPRATSGVGAAVDATIEQLGLGSGDNEPDEG